jgi:hypothetical protein
VQYPSVIVFYADCQPTVANDLSFDLADVDAAITEIRWQCYMAKKILRWFSYLVIASVAMYLTSDFVLNADKSKPAIEKFLASSEEAVAQVGNIKEIELVKKVSVSATDTSSPYRLYTFLVDGDKAKATVVVRVEQVDLVGTQERFLITRWGLD